MYPQLKDGKPTAGAGKAIKIASGADHVVILVEPPTEQTAGGKDKPKKNIVMTYGSADQGQLGRLTERLCARDGPHRPEARRRSTRAAPRGVGGGGGGGGVFFFGIDVRSILMILWHFKGHTEH